MAAASLSSSSKESTDIPTYTFAKKLPVSLELKLAPEIYNALSQISIVLETNKRRPFSSQQMSEFFLDCLDPRFPGTDVLFKFIAANAGELLAKLVSLKCAKQLPEKQIMTRSKSRAPKKNALGK